ncbi:MAG: hypothetical protein AAGK00_09105 [Pseudomonadota bacterium]
MTNALNNSMAGRVTGQNPIFFVGDASQTSETEQKRKKSVEEIIRTLAELMLDPAYVKRREEFSGFLDRTREWVTDSMAVARDVLGTIENTLSDMLDAAPRLPGGGPRIFRFADGRVIDEHGNTIDPSEVEGVIWPEDAPSAEEYLDTLNQRDAWTAQLERLERFEVDGLGRAQDRFNDQRNGMLPGEMDTFEESLQEERQHLEQASPDFQKSLADTPDNPDPATVSPILAKDLTV